MNKQIVSALWFAVGVVAVIGIANRTDLGRRLSGTDPGAGPLLSF